MLEAGNIIIVDDNPNNLQVLTGILQQQGYKVRPALSGAIALRAIAAHSPDLILLDIRMPEMDGYETCRRLKSEDGKRDIPVIFISALNEIDDKLSAFRAGAVDYITKPFQAEEVLARVHTQMELARTRRALSETNAQLLTMMEQLVQAEKLKSLGFMAAGVAHELNTPIGNAMLTSSAIDEVIHEFSRKQEKGVSQRELNDFFATCLDGSQIILRNLERASGLISALKEVSVDRSSERRRRINLLDTVANVVGLMNATLKKTPHAVLLDIDPDLVLETYPGHLEQILENLIQNALTHGLSAAESGTIRISAHKTKDSTINLTVSDDGKGIPAQNLSRIFDPFFTTRLGQGGSGLGLHIVYSLVTGLLGGNISVASKVGEGTQFTLSLPLVAPSEAAANDNRA